MDLLDKVRLIIGNKCESPSQFADEIDIPRSAVSHLLNGRNKPSLDVVRKIIKRYPDLGTDWIWDDEKMPALNEDTTNWNTDAKAAKKPTGQAYGKPLDLFSRDQPVPEAVHKNVSPVSPGSKPKKVERILLFFSDGTFEEFGAAE